MNVIIHPVISTVSARIRSEALNAHVKVDFLEMEFCAWPRGSRRVCLRLLGPGLCTQFASTIADSLSVPDLIFFAYCLPEAAFSGHQDMQFFICQLRAQAVRPKHDFWTSANRGTCSQLPIGVYYCLPARV